MNKTSDHKSLLPLTLICYKHYIHKKLQKRRNVKSIESLNIPNYTPSMKLSSE